MKSKSFLKTLSQYTQPIRLSLFQRKNFDAKKMGMGLFCSLTKLAICLILILQTPNILYAKINSAPCSPYYASTKSKKVNAHVGPGKNYKLVCEYTEKGVPVVITAKYDHWRRVKDSDGTESWIHKSQLSTKRFVITTSEKPCDLMKDTNDASQMIARIKKNVIMELLSVRGNWCKIEVFYKGNKISGWLKKENLFGVFDNETW